MKILLGNNSFNWLAGSEMYMLTLATELRKLEHEVTAYSPDLGLIATKLEGIGVKCVKELSGTNNEIKPFSPIFEEKEDTFDVIICAHHDITKYLHKKFPNVPIIAIVHGIIHENTQTGEIFPEHPVTDFKVDQYIAVSEEVQDVLLDKYGIQAKLLYNFFDLERFKKQGKLPSKPKSILVNSNYWGIDDNINKIIKEVAEHYDAKFMGVGANFAPTFEVNEVIKGADIVFGMGRSVLEGVCMGKIGVVHGRWGTGGVITPERYKTLIRTNCSGRGWKSDNKIASPQEIISQIDTAWNQKTIDGMYQIMKENHNVKIATKQILDIAKSLISSKI